MRGTNRWPMCWLVLFLFAVFAIGSNAQVVEEPTPVKVSTVLLNVPVVVSDKGGRNIAGLFKDDFQIEKNGTQQAIEFFATSDEPITVALVMDTSGSASRVLANIKKAAKDFVETLGPEDSGLVLSFDSRINLLAGLTTDKKKLIKGINSSYAADEAGSLMYDALFEVITKQFAARQGRKAIIVLTDGVVEGKKVTADALRNALIDSDTLVYPIYYQTGRLRKPLTMTMDEFVKMPWVSFLNSLAVSTGGRLLVDDADDFQSVFHQISEDLKKFYVLGFYPSQSDGKSNNIQIKVKREGVAVRTKGVIRVGLSK